MGEQNLSNERASLLADVAEMYYLEEKDQTEIARKVGVTRSMISRMLKEAREKGIVEIRVHRSLQTEFSLESALIRQFQLEGALVISPPKTAGPHYLEYLGSAGAVALKRYLKPGITLGTSWGTSVSAVVDSLQVEGPIAVKIVQLVGALGARNTEYDGHALVARLVEKLNGEAHYLNAPFLCPNPKTASTLLKTKGIQETIELGRKSDMALLGIGSTNPKFSSYYLAGYVPLAELKKLHQDGAVGDVCGLHFDKDGKAICSTFCKRLVTISKEDLAEIPLRIGVAGGLGKVTSILGALRAGYINFLVTDSDTAKAVLEQAGKDED
jgi:DNA-binding transcriptional regulator LsrR (DeoR family)